MRHARILGVVRRRRATIALALAAALTATAAAAAATSAVSPPQVLNYQAYVGGKGKARANLAPVKIGYINGQGGPVQLQLPAGDERHPSRREDDQRRARRRSRATRVKLSECFWAQAEEEGIRCGQQMVNDKVKTIIFGFVTVPNQSIYATVKGTIPITGVITSSAADPTARNAYFLNGSQTTGIGAFGTYTRRFHSTVKTAAVVYPTDPGAITAAAAVRTGLQQVRREGDHDRRSAARDRPDRAGDAGELV